MNADLRQRLTFDLARGELRDGDTRYLMLREDSLMGLFKAAAAATDEAKLSMPSLCPKRLPQCGIVGELRASRKTVAYQPRQFPYRQIPRRSLVRTGIIYLLVLESQKAKDEGGSIDAAALT